MHVPFTNNHQLQAIQGDICATIFNFGDKSIINESNVRQMEHVLHSIDFFIEISESFW